MTRPRTRTAARNRPCLTFYNTAIHWAIVVAPGFTDPSIFKVGGNPYGYSATRRPAPATT